MGKTIYRRLAAVVAVCLVLAAVTGCEKVVQISFKKNEVCQVGSQYVTKEQAAVLLCGMQKQYEKMFGNENLSKQFGDSTLEDYIKEQVKTQLVQLASMKGMAEDEKLSLNEGEKQMVSDAVKTFVSNFSEKQMKNAGFSGDDVEELYTQYALACKLYDKLTQSVNEEISDDAARIIDVQVIFFRNETTDETGKKAKLEGEALNAWKANAYQVWERAAAGENFESLAGEYNEAAQSEYQLGRGEMGSDAFDEAAFQLKNDEISGLVETDEGLYIIRCISNYDQAQTDANKKEIYEKQCSEAFNEAYDAFMKDTKVRLNEKAWNTVQLLKDNELPDVDFVQIYKDTAQ